MEPFAGKRESKAVTSAVDRVLTESLGRSYSDNHKKIDNENLKECVVCNYTDSEQRLATAQQENPIVAKEGSVEFLVDEDIGRFLNSGIDSCAGDPP